MEPLQELCAVKSESKQHIVETTSSLLLSYAGACVDLYDIFTWATYTTHFACYIVQNLFLVIYVNQKGMRFEIDDDTRLHTLQFADDEVICAKEKEDLEYMTRKVKE